MTDPINQSTNIPWRDDAPVGADALDDADQNLSDGRGLTRDEIASYPATPWGVAHLLDRAEEEGLIEGWGVGPDEIEIGADAVSSRYFDVAGGASTWWETQLNEGPARAWGESAMGVLRRNLAVSGSGGGGESWGDQYGVGDAEDVTVPESMAEEAARQVAAARSSSSMLPAGGLLAAVVALAVGAVALLGGGSS